MKTVSRTQLLSIADVVRRVAKPELIILFGSQARGTADKNSDIDLLIVEEPPVKGKWSRRRQIGRIRRSLPATGIPIDVLLFTPAEVQKWRDSTNHIISEALQEGEVLYERP